MFVYCIADDVVAAIEEDQVELIAAANIMKDDLNRKLNDESFVRIEQVNKNDVALLRCCHRGNCPEKYK